MKTIAVYSQDPVSKEQTLVNVFSDKAILGSGENVEIHLNDLRVSGVHAFVEVKENSQFKIIDLGSKSGVFINGKKTQENLFSSKDFIKIGNTHLFFKEVPKALAGIEVKQFIPKTEVKTIKKKYDKTLVKSFISDQNLLQVSLYWGQQLLEVRTFKSGSKISIGSDQKATFGLTLKDSVHYQLAEYKNQELSIDVPREISGLLWQGNDSFTIDELRKGKDKEILKIRLRVGDRADLKFGELLLSMTFVFPSEKLPRYLIPSIDRKLAKILSVLAFIYAMFFLLISLNHKGLQDKEEVKEIPERLQKIMYRAGVKEADKQQVSAIGERMANQSGRARGAEGQATVRKSEEKSKKVEKSEEEKTVTEDAKQKAPTTKIKEEKDVDVNAVFDKSLSKTIAEDLSQQGPNQQGNTLGALKGGNFARGTKGLGEGGGGESVGIGSVKGLATGGGEGADDYGLERSKGRDVDTRVEEEVILMDGLDPEIIAAVIKRYLPQIQQCYEAELAKKPKLKGKVLVHFVIKGDGLVKNEKILESGLKDGAVEKCILEKISKWQFPKPKGGVSVNVKYPFLLMSTSAGD